MIKKMLLGLALVATGVAAAQYSIQLVPGDTLTVTSHATTGTPVPPVVSPPVPPPVVISSCPPFTVRTIHMDWPTTQNVTSRTPGWTADTAYVVQFRSGNVGERHSFQVTNSGPPYNMKVISVSPLAGCIMPQSFQATADILKVIGSTSPIIRFQVGGVQDAYKTWTVIKPNTDYYITMFNSDSIPFSNSCIAGDCGAGIRLDFNI